MDMPPPGDEGASFREGGACPFSSKRTDGAAVAAVEPHGGGKAQRILGDGCLRLLCGRTLTEKDSSVTFFGGSCGGLKHELADLGPWNEPNP